MNKKKINDIFVMGMALFSMFFGAGNLIFPPLLGKNSGIAWVVGFIFFFLFDAFLAILAILALVKKKNYSFDSITGVMGRVPSRVISCIAILCLGPLLAIPRTCATTYEIGILSLFSNFSSWIFSFIFFLIVLILSIKPNRVVDVVGGVITPLLFVGLLLIIFKGIISPIGLVRGINISYAIKVGTYNGYQTLDMIGAIIFVGVIANSARNKGYNTTKSLSKVLIYASLVAGLLLLVIYGGLTYLGASTSLINDSFTETSLIVYIVNSLFGRVGILLLSIIVFLACISTAIGLTSACCVFFESFTKYKLSYKIIAVIICTFSFLISNIGVSNIIKFSSPILMIIYPGILILIVLSFFSENIKNKNIYYFSFYSATIISFIEVISNMGLDIGFIDKLPLANLGFSWLIPSIIFGFLGYLIPYKKITS